MNSQATAARVSDAPTRFGTRPLYIGGRYVDSSGPETFESINPATGEVLARVQQATAADIDAAVLSASEGQKVWGAMSTMARSRVLRRAVDILRQRNDELAMLETLDTGRPLSETIAVDIVTGADVLEYFAGLAPSLEGRQIPLRETSFVYTRREPLGVIAAIGAWNYPIQIALWKSAPALAAGNAVIFKPSEMTPLSALILAEIYTEAGLPAGCFNVLNGVGPVVGAALTEHPGIEKVSFTGGTATGKKVMASASASTLKEVTMELGGKSPLLILRDADLDLAADIAAAANFYSTGQVCTHGTRVFIPKALSAEFEARIVQRARGLRMGDPLDRATNLGPLVSFPHREKVLSYIAHGKDEGARLVTGGKAPTADSLAFGAFVEPTIFADCTDDMAIVRDEIFGPLMSILTYEDEEEAIRRANATTYGLAAGVVTRDIGRAHSIVQRLEAGVCWINTWGETPAEMPLGGYKQSGVGRENGIETLERYTQVKSVQVELGRFANPF